MGPVLGALGVLLLFLLNLAITIVALLAAIPLVVLLWMVWALVLAPSRLFDRPPETLEIPGVDSGQSLDVPLDRLLGPRAPGYIDAVFEGGGVKAVTHVGSAYAIERMGLQWSLLGGTSGGAIVAAMLAAGRSSQETWQVLAGLELHRLASVRYLPSMPWLQRMLYLLLPLLPRLMLVKGLVSPGELRRVLQHNLRHQGRELRFGDLLNPEADGDPRAPRHRLRVVTTDISRGTPVVLPDDLPCYWDAWRHAAQVLRSDAADLSPEDVQDAWPVAEAVRMSASIPFFYSPAVLHLNADASTGALVRDHMADKGKKVLMVDGGISSNFPIWIFDRLDKTPRWPTFGFLLDESRREGGVRKAKILSIGSVLDMALAVISTGMGAMDKRLSAHDEYRTAHLRTLGVKSTDFGITMDTQRSLFISGYEDTMRFLQHFDWRHYLREFRQPQEAPRD